MEKEKKEGMIALGILGAIFLASALKPKKVTIPETGETGQKTETTITVTETGEVSSAQREITTETGKTIILPLTVENWCINADIDEANKKIIYSIWVNITQGQPPFYVKAIVQDTISGEKTATKQSNTLGKIELKVEYPLTEGYHEYNAIIKVWDSISSETEAIILNGHGSFSYKNLEQTIQTAVTQPVMMMKCYTWEGTEILVDPKYGSCEAIGLYSSPPEKAVIAPTIGQLFPYLQVGYQNITNMEIWIDEPKPIIEKYRAGELEWRSAGTIRLHTIPYETVKTIAKYYKYITSETPRVVQYGVWESIRMKFPTINETKKFIEELKITGVDGDLWVGSNIYVRWIFGSEYYNWSDQNPVIKRIV